MSIMTCPECGAKNRVDESQSQTMNPTCGRCGTKLEAGSNGNGHPVEVTDQSLANLLASAGEKPVLVDCWAEWCPPCRALAPVLDQLAGETTGKYVIAKLNVDDNPETATKFRVGSIPTMLVFKNGKLVDEMVGMMPKPKIAERLARHA